MAEFNKQLSSAKTMMTMSLSSGGNYYGDHINSFMDGYGKEVIQLRKAAFDDEWWNILLKGAYGNAVSVQSRVFGVYGRAQMWGCLEIAQELTRTLKRLDTSNMFKVELRFGRTPLPHYFVRIKTLDGQHSWVTTAWETGYASIMPEKDYRIQTHYPG